MFFVWRNLIMQMEQLNGYVHRATFCMFDENMFVYIDKIAKNGFTKEVNACFHIEAVHI